MEGYNDGLQREEEFLTLCADSSAERLDWIRHIKSRLRSKTDLHHIHELYVNRKVDMG